uniref:Uncharacterized protein n=1 Tax=Romanomermis culicivorax TaxID=13658 RepID=A0A915J122_ROMCU
TIAYSGLKIRARGYVEQENVELAASGCNSRDDPDYLIAKENREFGLTRARAGYGLNPFRHQNPPNADSVIHKPLLAKIRLKICGFRGLHLRVRIFF